MTISSVKTGAIGDSLLAGNAAYDPGAFVSIATFTASGGETSLTFSSIPSTYASLQIRYQARRGASGVATTILQPNGDTTTANYAYHYLRGTGSAASAFGTTGTAGMYLTPFSGTNYPASGVGIIDIHDYASTTKAKTVRSFGGFDDNATIGISRIELNSGLWTQTTAISSLVFTFGGDTLNAGSVFSLYGIKGA